MAKIHLKGHISPNGDIELKTPKVGFIAGGIAALAAAFFTGAANVAGSYLCKKWLEKKANKEERSQQ